MLSETPSSAAEQATPSNKNAATQLAEAIDEFLVDVEKKFKVMNDEILTKCLHQSPTGYMFHDMLTDSVDDMAERCDKLEAELLLREAEGTKITSGSGDGSS